MKRILLSDKVGNSWQRGWATARDLGQQINPALLVSLLGMAILGLSGFAMFGNTLSDSTRALVLTDGWVLIIKIVALLMVVSLYGMRRTFFEAVLQKLEPSYPASFGAARFSGQKTGVLASLVLGLCMVGSSALVAQSGTAFRDFNGDGLQTGAEPGVEGVIVRIYGNAVAPAKDQFVGETVTGVNGNFNFATLVTSGRAANAGEKVRIEFTIPTSAGCDLADNVDFTGQNGTVYGTSVQFIVGLQSGIKFAINYPGQWVDNPDPTIMLPCYSFGEPTLGGDAGSAPAFISYAYSENGIPASHSSGNAGVPDPNLLATIGEVGSLYGVAFSRPAQKVFTSAVLRRHAAFGPLGSGGIYLIDPFSAAADKTTDWLNLDAIGIWTYNHAGSYPANPGNNTSPNGQNGFIGSSAQRALGANRHTPSTDFAAGDQVGKVSIGDIDISDDGRYLYIVNLYDRKIYEIDMVDPANPQAPTLGNVATRVRSWDAPDPGTTNLQGEHRPWGLKYYRGKLYVGIVLCGQDISGNVTSPVIDVNGQKVGTDVRGYVYDFDPNTAIFSQRLNFSFNYGRERGWIPWGYSTLSGLSRYFSGTEREIAEPIIADLEFDDAGNMLIGVLDRKGHQYAINNNDYNGTLVGYEYSTAGELLRANTDANCQFSIVTRPGTTDYYDDNIIHPESLQGPLAVLPGGGDAIAVVLDPIAIRSGGTIRFNNTTGARVGNSAYEVFDDRFTLSQPGATPSKANGLGDVELSGSEAPIEIGNRVWADMDRDGIQDSGEPGVPGVHVQLKTPGGVVLATAITNLNGNYFFNDSNVTDGDPLTPGNQPGLLPLTAYKVCILASEFADGQPLNNFGIATPDQAGTGLADFSDSDGFLQGNGDVVIMFTTGNSGQNNHSYDFGVIPTDYGDLPDSYHTTEANNGPWQLINTNLKLGACVDGETDGQPQAMAGMMTGGDDNTVGLVTAGDCGPGGDDENGITFTSPLIPGSSACITVNAMNMTASAAKLQGWIDYNGNGMFEPAEELSTGSFAPGGATVPVGGLSNAVMCFDVPAGATFQGGAAFARFRLTPTGNLGPLGGSGQDGEVEDYKVTLAKIGNLVWSDFNDNGVQNAGETGINGVTVTLTYLGANGTAGGGDDVTYTATTATMGASDGIYMFLGLIPGSYTVAPTPPAGYLPGKEDQGGNDVLDSDAHAGVAFTIPANILLPTGENGIGDNPGGTNGFPDAQDNLTFDFNYIGLDYGDLPDTYGTTTPNGPAHAITPNLKLGTRVDAEANGQPDAMAGLMTGGDDNNQGAPAFGGAGDDEDGIVFSGPMVPGNQACITVSAMNMTGSAAVLQGWIDWNGNGQFEAAEQLTTGNFAPAGATIPNGGVTNQQFCFTVPADAVFAAGNVMSRFRLSPTGGLTATGALPNGGVPLGEVEDYKTATAKIANFVWWDYNNDGIQNEDGTSGINGVTVQLVWAGPDNNLATLGDNVTFTDVTIPDNGTNGQYAFCGLIPGTYQLSIPTPPANFVPTQLNQGANDAIDSDNPAGVTIVIPVLPGLITGENGTGDAPGSDFPDNQDDYTNDFGYVAYDYGDLPDTYGTTTGNNGASQLLNPNLYLGTCVDAEVNGQPQAMAGLMTGGDDNNASGTLIGSCGTAADDENGIVLFETPMIPGYQACIRVTAVNTTGSGAVLQGWVDFNGNGTFEAGEQLTTGSFAPSGSIVPNGGIVNMQMCFDVPATATFTGGQVFIRFRLSQNGGLPATGPAGIGGIGEVEDYKVALAKVGNYVWNDWDNNGQQNEPGVAGINNITVNLLWAGPDLAFGTADDRLYTDVTATEAGVEGKYDFCGLIPGSYKISLPTLPANYIPTQLGIGSDVSDSDDPAGEMVMIPALPGLPTGENATGDNPGAINAFPDAQDNLTVDFGLITRDFGDAPDTYGTTDGSPTDGAVHVLNPNLKLGACADGDPDGQPDPMAGLMSGGDDNTTGSNLDGTASTCGDDEDGIMLVSPLVPGYTATIMVTAMNMLGTNAVLQGWVDYNGDGDFTDANEAITFTNVGGGSVPSPTGLNGAKLTFVVPAAATFTGGNAFMRFRISPAGGLTPNGPENMPFPIGEVEDYKVALAKIGSFVWNDNNNDGIQNEPGSNGLNGTTVQLVWPGPDGDFATAADNLTYTTVTSNMNGTNGQYMFLGLTPGNYSVSIPTNPSGFIPTQLNQGGNDVVDSDDPGGQPITIPNPPTTLPTGENGTGDVPNDPNFPDPQNDFTIDFGFVSVDYGDLPVTYGTTIADGGPRHIVNPNLKLGSSVDGELNGQPEAMAGLMTGGDDGNVGGYNEGGAGDDENGVIFLTPMIPGYQACVRVNTMNTLGGSAVLQGWIDWNGDGDVADAGEELSTGSFAAAANGAIVPAGASINTDFCFEVPANATFFGGQAFARFRLSPTGGLTSGGPAAMPYPIGEVEDYKLPLAKAGNYVWIDANINGIQDENGVLGINNVTVQLQWAGPDGNFNTAIDNRTYEDVTATVLGVNGKYLFCGLIPGNYRMVVPPFGYVPTLVIDVNGNTQDFVDADNPAGVNFTVPNPLTTLPTGENGTGDSPLVIDGFPDNQGNVSFDFGYLGFDFGDLPDTYGTTQGAGNPGPDGAVHTVNPDLYLGPSVDVDIDGQPEAMAGFMTGGDDGNTGPGTLGISTPAGDDENGISFPTPLIPGSPACVKVTARNATASAAVLQAWIDFNGDGQFQVSEQLTTGNFTPAGASIPVGGVTNQNYCFDVPADASFNGGNLFARFRLSQNGGVTATGPAIPGNGVFPTGEVEDYKLPLALVGNYVWMDNPDIEGDQDATEMPLENVKINLTWAGEDGIFQTAVNSATPAGDDRIYMDVTDASGRYEFRGLIPSTNYRLLPNKYTAANAAIAAGINPVNKILTIPNLIGNDNQDADGVPVITISIPNLTNGFLPTGENGLQDNNGLNGFPDNQENLSLDFGFIDEPRIAAALAIKGFQKASSGTCGHFDVIMDLCVKNNSTAPLAQLQAMLDMAGANAYGTAFLGLVPSGAPQIVSSTAQQNPVLNGAYTGVGVNKNLFNGTSGLLWPGEQVCIRFRFEVNPLATGAPANPKAQAMVTGKAQNFQGVPIPDYFNGGAQYVATDLSDAGMDAMSTNPDDPSDLGTANDPTALGNCWQVSQDLVANDLLHVSISPTCETLIGSTQVLEGEADQCTEEVYPLGGFYQVTVFNFQNQPIPNPVPLSYIGQTLVFKATHIMTCNTTWGTFILEDKVAPVISCSDINLSCAITNYSPSYLFNTLGFENAYPTVFDCTPTSTPTYVDSWFDLGCDSPNDLSASATRIWNVHDAWGNMSSCTQHIYFERRHINDVTLPADITIDCSDFVATAAHPTPSPAVAGAPYIEEFGMHIPVYPNNTYCELAANYTDEVYEICEGSFKVLRSWSLVDWCLPTTPTPPLTNPYYYIQLIKVLDAQGPQIACPADMTVSTNPSQCCATVNLPDAFISDNCSHVDSIGVKIFVYDQYIGDLIGTQVVSGYLSDFPNNNYWNSDTLGVFGNTQCLPVGTHVVQYLAKDACGNYSYCSFDLTVADFIPPVATCTEFTTVAIGIDDPTDCYVSSDACSSAGVTWVPASAFNQGSYDNCNGVGFTIRRMQEADETYSDCIDGLTNLCEGAEYNVATAENDSIKFYCCEVGTTQTVILRVYQTDLYGNWMTYEDGSYIYNECMVNVEVQDKIKPTCQPPANVTVSCENFEPSLWAYGYPTITDNCCLDETPPTSINPEGQVGIPAGTSAISAVCGATQKTYYSGFLNANFDTTCNRGTIIRRFTAWDCAGFSNSCTQRIVVEYTQDYNILFPADVSVNCTTEPNIGKPVITNDEGCELIGVSYNDVVFTVVPDACYKIERTWTVINWCTYNPDLPCYALPRNPANQTTGLAPAKSWRVYLANEINDENCVTYKQIIKVLDQTPPTVVCQEIDTCDVSTNLVRYWNDGLNWWDNGTHQHDLCEKETEIAVTAEDLCDTISPSGGLRFRYLLFLDTDGDGIMETVVSSADINTRPVGQVLYNNYQSFNYGTGANWTFDNNSNFSQRYRFDIEQTAGGARVIWRNASGTKLPELPHGRHKIKWIAEDGCGNEAVCEKTFEIKDCKPPVVACANVNINLMVGGVATLWATDFFLYGDDNCTPVSILNPTLAVIRADENPDNTYPGGSPDNQNVVLTCADQGTDVPVQVWLMDAAGNADFCLAYANVQANLVGCDGTTSATVAGTLATEGLQGVEDASVELAMVAPNGQQGILTHSSSNVGSFQFPYAVPMSGDYTLTPTKDDNPLNGVTTYDLVLINKHILGLEPLNTPYKMIAADANRSGSITTFDIVEFRKLILGIYNELPNNTSWRFVDKSFAFADPSNPFQVAFPENKSVADLQSDQMTDHFVGVKIGDVNNTVIANSFQSVDDRSAATMLFDVEDRTVRAGEVFTLNFKGAERVQGYQFTMNMNGLEVQDIVPGTDMKLDNFGVFASSITTSVDGAANEFAVTFRASKAGQISQMLGVSSRITKAEAYSLTNDRLDIAFRFNSSAGTTISGVGFELYQNQPNPFVNKTFIGFHLPEATSATLRILDETGRMVFAQKGEFGKGYNSFAIDRQLITSTGVLYYSVETTTDSATKKMIQSK